MDLFFAFFKRILIKKTAFLNKVKFLTWSRFALFLLLKNMQSQLKTIQPQLKTLRNKGKNTAEL